MAAHIREEAGIFVPYLDNFLLIGDSLPLIQALLARTLSILGELGWIINREKSSLVPAQLRQFLGIVMDSKVQKYFLPQGKIDAISRSIHPLFINPKTFIKKAMSFTWPSHSSSSLGPNPLLAAAITDPADMGLVKYQSRPRLPFIKRNCSLPSVVVRQGQPSNRKALGKGKIKNPLYR